MSFSWKKKRPLGIAFSVYLQVLKTKGIIKDHVRDIESTCVVQLYLLLVWLYSTWA